MQVLNGSLVALVTPMMPNGEIDFNALDKIIDWHIEEGTNGIVSVGTTGESATVNFDEHIEIIKHTINHVNGRVPVIAGTGANSTSEALDLTMEAKNAGANILVSGSTIFKENKGDLKKNIEILRNN